MLRPRILLVGRTGQVGRELESLLCAWGELVVTQRGPSDQPQVRSLDLSDVDAIRATVRDVKPTLIVNAAAHTAVDKAESERELAVAINTTAPGVLAEEAKRCGASFVHYSTDYVFDGSGTRPWREDDPTGPLSVYGQTKLDGERLIAASGCAHLIARTSWVYATIGHNFVRTMLRLGATRERLTIVADQHGAPTSALVIARTTIDILRQAPGDIAAWLTERGGVVHLACSGETTWHGFATEIFRQARALGVTLAVNDVAPLNTADYPTPARRPLNSRLDMTRLRERFGIVTPDWSEALRETLPGLLAANPLS
jgi:dTDP-4-dehydrorhamnose reductase